MAGHGCFAVLYVVSILAGFQWTACAPSLKRTYINIYYSIRNINVAEASALCHEFDEDSYLPMVNTTAKLLLYERLYAVLEEELKANGISPDFDYQFWTNATSDGHEYFWDDHPTCTHLPSSSTLWADSISQAQSTYYTTTFYKWTSSTQYGLHRSRTSDSTAQLLVCEKEQEACEYKGQSSNECPGSSTEINTLVINSIAKEEDCQAECNAFVSGEAECWGILHSQNTTECTILYHVDPYIQVPGSTHQNCPNSYPNDIKYFKKKCYFLNFDSGEKEMDGHLRRTCTTAVTYNTTTTSTTTSTTTTPTTTTPTTTTTSTSTTSTTTTPTTTTTTPTSTTTSTTTTTPTTTSTASTSTSTTPTTTTPTTTSTSPTTTTTTTTTTSTTSTSTTSTTTTPTTTTLTTTSSTTTTPTTTSTTSTTNTTPTTTSTTPTTSSTTSTSTSTSSTTPTPTTTSTTPTTSSISSTSSTTSSTSSTSTRSTTATPSVTQTNSVTAVSATRSTSQTPLFIRSCLCYTSNNENITLEERTEEIVKELTIDTSKTSASIRSKTSAKDKRSSSVSIGLVAILIVSIPLALMLILDLSRLCERRKTARDQELQNIPDGEDIVAETSI